VKFAIRLIPGLLFASALLLTAAGGWCAEQNFLDNIDQQIAERAKQYRETLRQRAEQLSPSLQAEIESQAQRTIAKGLEQWEKGELDIRIALPERAEIWHIAQLLARYSPFSGVPAGSFEFGAGLFVAALTVTSVQHVLRPLAISAPDAVAVVPSAGLLRQGGDGVSYFIRIVLTIVQRR